MQNNVNEQRQMHRVNVTVSQPDHTMVSKRKDQVQKVVAVRADSRDHALSKATQYYKDRGYKVHGQEYIGLKEEVKEQELEKTESKLYDKSFDKYVDTFTKKGKTTPDKQAMYKNLAKNAYKMLPGKSANPNLPEEVEEQFAIMHKVVKKILSTHDDEASAKDEWKGLDQSERPFYKIVKTNKKPNDFSMKEGVSEGSVTEAQYNDDDHYAIHPDTGKVMDSWSKRDSRVNAVMSQQHKDKGHIIKTGRELNYAEYAKSKNEMTNISQAINLLIKEHTANISEKLNLAKADMGDVIKDFQTSDAPQFQGKSKEKRRQMAIAAKLGADRGARNEETEDEYEYDREGDMAKTDLRSIIANAQRVHDMLEDDSNLPEWVQSKITLAEDYISTVANYMSAEKEE